VTVVSRRRQNFVWEDLPESAPGRIEDRTAPDYAEPPPPTMAELTERADRERRERDLTLPNSDLAQALGAGDIGKLGRMILAIASLFGRQR